THARGAGRAPGVGWPATAEFTADQRPRPAAAARAVDWTAYAAAGACGLLALAVGWARLRRADPRAFALVVLLPVLMTRYAWPTHYAMALPAVAFAGARARLCFALGTGVFYLAHLRPLEPIGAAGPLLFGGVLLALALVRPQQGAR